MTTGDAEQHVDCLANQYNKYKKNMPEKEKKKKKKRKQIETTELQEKSFYVDEIFFVERKRNRVVRYDQVNDIISNKKEKPG